MSTYPFSLVTAWARVRHAWRRHRPEVLTSWDWDDIAFGWSTTYPHSHGLRSLPGLRGNLEIHVGPWELRFRTRLVVEYSWHVFCPSNLGPRAIVCRWAGRKKRFQLAWHWRPSTWRLGFELEAPALMQFYRWRRYVGPLEIRHWIPLDEYERKRPWRPIA